MRPYLVLASALFTDARSWAPALSRLTLDAEVDHVPTPAEALENAAYLNAYVEDVITRIERAEEARRVVLVGHSLGAYIAARALGRMGTSAAKVAHFVGVGGLVRMPADLVRARADLAREVEAGRVPARAVVEGMARGAVGDDAESAASLLGWLEHLSSEALVAGLRRTDPLAEDAWAVTPFSTPTTLIHGREDTSVPFACGEELARHLPNAELVALGTSSHMLPMTHSAVVASMLDRALGG